MAVVITSRLGRVSARAAKRVDSPRWLAVIRVVVRVCPVESVYSCTVSSPATTSRLPLTAASAKLSAGVPQTVSS